MTASNAKRPALEEGNGQNAGSKQAPGLYLVSTPIGNLGDITLRAAKILESVDLIACEDTRNTGRLLTLLNIPKKQLVPYHEHNAEKAAPRLARLMEEGMAVALVSDAGTPLISDPGYRLVQACAEREIPITAIPGACAAVTALQLSGLPCHRFLFEGFLAHKKSQRRRRIEELSRIPATLIFYESPQRLIDCLSDLLEGLGDRDAAVARELTKMHEEVKRGPLSGLLALYREKGEPKGEIVIIVGPAPEEAEPDETEIDRALEEALKTRSVKDAAADIAETLGISKRVAYGRALFLSQRREADGAD